MRTKSNPAVIGLVVAAYVFCATVAVVLLACAHRPPPPPKDDAPTQVMYRTPAERANATVRVITTCGTGTGVLVDGKRVLTAFHVINCAEWPLFVPPIMVVVETIDNTRYSVTSVKGDPGKDIALLEIADEVTGIRPAVIKHATVDAPVCIETAVPSRVTKCGVVSAFAEPTDEERYYGDVWIKDASVWFGNSGSGVYDDQGALVGILVRLKWCDSIDAMLWRPAGEPPKKTCGGRVSSIDDSTVLK